MRGEVGAKRRVRGTIHEFELVESPSRPNTLPASGARERSAALSLVYNLIIIIVCWVFYTVMTNAGAERQPAKGVA